MHKSTLPVEIFSFKSEAQAKGVAQTIEAIRALGNVTFRDLAAKKNTQLWKVSRLVVPITVNKRLTVFGFVELPDRAYIEQGESSAQVN